MTSARSSAMTDERPIDPLALLRPLSSPRTWRANLHVAAGMVLGVTTGSVVLLLGLLWWAAVVSLVEGPTGHWLLPALYVVVAVVGPLAIPPWVRFLSALQRERFRAVLGVEITEPKHDPGSGWHSVLRPW